MFSIESSQQNWRNWSGSEKANNITMYFPKNENEISDVIKLANSVKKKIRVIGGSHSFSPIAKSEEFIVSMKYLTGIISINKIEYTANVYAGTILKDLNLALDREGFAIENLGDVDKQSISGAISTGTHGTGAGLKNLASLVTEIDLIDGLGQFHTLTETDGDRFQAAVLSLGLFGIITKLKLKIVPSYFLKLSVKKITLTNCLENFTLYNQNFRNFEFFWVPHTDYVQAKFSNLSVEKPQNMYVKKIIDYLFENLGLYFFQVLTFLFKKHTSIICKMMTHFITNVEQTTSSFQSYITTRIVKFHEMEYAFPVEKFPFIMNEIKNHYIKATIPISFPVEVRFQKGDDALLSVAHKTDSVYFAIHQFHLFQYKDFFMKLEKTFKDYGGKPHWGKLQFLGPQYLKKIHPRINDFTIMRRRFDPNNIFLNKYLYEIFF